MYVKQQTNASTGKIKLENTSKWFNANNKIIEKGGISRLLKLTL